MTRQHKAEYVLAQLTKLYPEPKVPLDSFDPFSLLIAVLLSAQCTDKRVNLVTPHLFALGKTPKAFSILPVSKIQEVIRPCGLSNTKAKAIVGLSQILVSKYHEEVPQNFEELESLPGVGHKTASVVMAQAFGVPAFPVDTHIHRLAYRWGLTNGKNVTQTEKDLKKVFPEKFWNKLHLQIIFYGREYCPARGHDLAKCFICEKIAVRSRLESLSG